MRAPRPGRQPRQCQRSLAQDHALLDEPVALAAWFGLALVIASVILTGGAAQAATAKPQVSAT